jgi:hypothetical protein
MYTKLKKDGKLNEKKPCISAELFFNRVKLLFYYFISPKTAIRFNLNIVYPIY